MTKEQEELLEIAKRDYPVGTKFNSLFGGCGELVVMDNNYSFPYEDLRITVTTNKGTGTDKKNSAAITNHNGKWAEIVSRPEPEKWEPKVGDWVVITSNSGPVNKKGDIGKITTPKQKDNSFRVDCGKGNTSNWESDTSCRPALPHEIPQEEVEYWEFIADNGGAFFTKGKIYKAINTKDIETVGNFIDNYGNENGYTGANKEKFKPSTRQAYEAQQRVEFAINVTNEVINNVSQINQSKNEKTKCNTKITIQDLISCGQDYSFPTGKRRTGAKIQLEGCVLPSKSRPVRG
jgi:hypothetical protein